MHLITLVKISVSLSYGLINIPDYGTPDSKGSFRGEKVKPLGSCKSAARRSRRR